jgi:glycosyltransferase involved in cell wall biosynthesis
MMNNTNKIKVAFFSDVLRENLDGVTYTMYNIIERIPQDRFDYLFITPFPPSDPSLIPYPVYRCPYVRFPLYGAYPFAFPAFSTKLKRVLDDFKPDIVHFTTPTLLGRYAVKYAMEKRIHLFSTYHTHFMSYIEYYTIFKFLGGIERWKGVCGRIMRWMYNRCELTFVPTEPIREEMVSFGIDDGRLVTWGRGIDMTQYNQDFRDNEYIDSLAGKNTKRILFVSRLVWEKEIRTLIGIYKRLEAARPDIKMILTGEGPQKKYLERMMPKAIFTGKLIGDELARIYASCDLFVFPSVTETFGNVVLEALASGLPSVVAAKGGPMGIVKNGKNGFHAIPKDVADFCDKITRILDDPELHKAMRRNAIDYARSQSWDALCERMFAIYMDALKKKQAPFEVGSEIAI